MYIARKHELWSDSSYHQYDTASEILSNISGTSIGFKAVGDLSDSAQRGAVQGSQLVPNIIYFTPCGIMMGGHMIAEPTPKDEIDDIKSRLNDVEAVSGGALKFVGAINKDGCVEQINAVELPSLAQQAAIIRDTNAIDNVEVTINGHQKQITYIPIENIVEAICSQPIGSESGVLSLQLPVNGVHLVIPSLASVDYSVVGTDTVLSFPYDITSEDVYTIRTAYTENYGGGRFAGSGVFLYIETIGSDAAILTLNAATFTKNAIRFEHLTRYTELLSGYVFVAQDPVTLITGDGSTIVNSGDMIIISSDKLQVPNSSLTKTDFSIIKSGTNKMASPTESGLMSSASWDRLWNDLTPVGIATKSDSGQIIVGDGLVVNEAGKTDVRLAPTFEQLPGSPLAGVQLKIYGRDNGANLLSGPLTMPLGVTYNPYIPTATQDRYGVVKIGTGLAVSGDGTISATANLVWA